MDKKNFLFVTYDALITDIAWQCAKEGHNVKFYTDHEEEKEVGDGFVPKVDNWKKEVDWADTIIFDDTLGLGKKAQSLRERDCNVVGGTAYTDRLEDDRSFGQEELKDSKVPILPYNEFISFDEAINYVQENPNRYVIKPSGEAANIKRLLFVGQDEVGKDIIQVLEAYRKAWSKKIKVFQLQRYVSGVEVAVGAFFNGYEFVYPINVNFEHKKLFPGNIGPSTGEMGTSMFWSPPNRIFNNTLARLVPKLRRENYVGYIDINCIVNANGIYPLEFTSRFGYPTISIQQEGMLSPISELLYKISVGEMPKLKVKSGFQVGVRVVVPPFPYKDKKTFKSHSKDSIIYFKKPNRDGVHIEDVKLVNQEWLITGVAGVALIVCGCGQTMNQAIAQAYKRIDNIIIPNSYYRKDIGERWNEDSDKLHNWGYLR